MFSGFPPEAMTFFRGLARNNNRDWFQPRKEIYETKVKAPMCELVEAINAEMLKFAPDYINDPKKAIYRIYRDTRFSKDKTPYKTHIAAVFPRRGLEKHAGAGLYFSISPQDIEIAGGVYMPGPEQLLAIRTWLAENHAEFRKASRGPEKLMGKLYGDSLQRVPKGFDAAHPAACRGPGHPLPGRQPVQDETVALRSDARRQARHFREARPRDPQAFPRHGAGARITEHSVTC